MRKIESVPNVQDVYVSKRREFSTQYGLHNENPFPSFYLLLNPPRGAGSEAEPGLVHIIINTIYTFSACSVLGVPNDDAANDFIVALANHSDNAYNWDPLQVSSISFIYRCRRPASSQRGCKRCQHFQS